MLLNYCLKYLSKYNSEKPYPNSWTKLMLQRKDYSISRITHFINFSFLGQSLEKSYQHKIGDGYKEEVGTLGLGEVYIRVKTKLCHKDLIMHVWGVSTKMHYKTLDLWREIGHSRLTNLYKVLK